MWNTLIKWYDFINTPINPQFEIIGDTDSLLVKTMTNMCVYCEMECIVPLTHNNKPSKKCILTTMNNNHCDFKVSIVVSHPSSSDVVWVDGLAGLRYVAKIMKTYPNMNRKSTAMVDVWIDKYVMMITTCSMPESKHRSEVCDYYLREVQDNILVSDSEWLDSFDCPTLADFLWIELIRHIDQDIIRQEYSCLQNYASQLC
jgi:hypothetical protein